ncbi:hypothetical protein [Thioalkalivibrio sp. HK1]|uniref:hypothetical protein n=1 Tax=Thioalkalivibrio sp. HK1 TaxID=1469245 RepID=UPI001E47C915|nr:hypothetical protein [Thioalkalivibrio sp. HK1]
MHAIFQNGYLRKEGFKAIIRTWGIARFRFGTIDPAGAKPSDRSGFPRNGLFRYLCLSSGRSAAW